MTQQSFCQNLINLRKSKNLSTESCAMVAGISTELYEKMELGFEKVTFEVLEKLAKFYQIDIAYFMEEHEVKTTNTASSVKPAKQNANYPKTTKAFNILGIIFAAMLLLLYALVPIAFIYSYTFTFWDLFGGSAVAFMTAFFTLIYILWSFVNQIVMTSSIKTKCSVYGLVDGIVSLALVSLDLVLNFYLLTQGFAEPGFIIFICILGLDLIFAIVRLVKVVKLRRKIANQ